MGKKEKLIIGLDIGTTKICAIVAEVTSEGLDVVGMGTHPSRGLRKGVVINIEATVESIRRAIEEAEVMAGCEISSVYTGIAGGHIKGFNSHGIVAVKDREIKPSDVKRVIDAAQAVAIPMDREVIHILPQEFIIDEQDGIREPVGMSGVRLEAKVHIVTGAVTSAQNIIKCCNRCGLTVNDIVLEPLASSLAVVSDDEKEIGVALIDIGGGTTDLALFADGSIKHTSVLSLGGNHVTNDIAIGLRTPFSEAENIKRQYGIASSRLVSGNEIISVPSVGGGHPRELSRKLLADIVDSRMEEIFSLIKQEIIRSGYERIAASGVVITGGSSIMEGTTELAEEIFELPVRRGIPGHIGGLQEVVNSPMYATGVGLVLYGNRSLNDRRFRIREDNIFSKVRNRMQEWFYEYF